jgi:hypothetical protein
MLRLTKSNPAADAGQVIGGRLAEQAKIGNACAMGEFRCAGARRKRAVGDRTMIGFARG